MVEACTCHEEGTIPGGVAVVSKGGKVLIGHLYTPLTITTISKGKRKNAKGETKKDVWVCQV